MQDLMFTSPSYGKLDLNGVISVMRKFYDRNVGGNFSIVIGTDSQNFSDTKMVSVIAMCCEGHGGIYFYKIERINRIQDVSQKLNYETQLSLQYADELLKVLMETDEELFFETVKECQEYFGEKHHRFITNRVLHKTISLYKNIWRISYKDEEYGKYTIGVKRKKKTE